MSNRTIVLTLRVMNGFRLDDEFVPHQIDDDIYSFTYVEGEPGPSNDEVHGNKQLLVNLLRQFADRLDSPEWQEVKYVYEIKESAADQVLGEIPASS
jgi:hypothetical protein